MLDTNCRLKHEQTLINVHIVVRFLLAGHYIKRVNKADTKLRIYYQ